MMPGYETEQMNTLVIGKKCIVATPSYSKEKTKITDLPYRFFQIQICNKMIRVIDRYLKAGIES